MRRFEFYCKVEKCDRFPGEPEEHTKEIEINPVVFRDICPSCMWFVVKVVREDE
jgi:hypothetical protein